VRVSIVIPFKRDNAYLRETIAFLKEIDFHDYEIFLLPDEYFSWGDSVQVIPTGSIGPGAKRDAALAHATGEVVAFLDDDTFPARDWLKNAVKYFDDPSVAAIGGPAVTPASDGLRQQASGAVYTSLLGGGNYAYRYIPKDSKQVDDYPTCNLLVRRQVTEQVGGFDTNFWPGEDTKLCLEITRRLGMKIIYAPDVVVYHHRRPLFAGHLKQVRSYALHRGYFVKRFPETSFRLSYFLPTFLTAGLVVGGIASAVIPGFGALYAAGIVGYVAAVLLSAAQVSFHFGKAWRLTILVASGIIATHLVYGVWFVLGLLAPRLGEESPSE
jgi:GT2 family glycosyltransferase